MANQTQAKRKNGKRHVRSEAVVILTLGSLLMFLLISMGISLLARTWNTEEPAQAEVQTPPSITNGKTIVIDPGHGGYDIGCEMKQYNEKTITLEIAKQLGQALEALGYRVVYTRTTDTALGSYELEDLGARVAIGEKEQADAFISLHLNKADELIQERCYGFEIYHQESNVQGVALAQNIHTALSSLEYTESRGIRNGAALQVVANNRQPAILIELGFLDDDSDRGYLTSFDGQKEIAEALAKGIAQSFP